MTDSVKRLGDLIDDYCPRCRLLLNHAIASMVDGEVVKVICQTCLTEHPYRHGEGGKKKLPAPRAELFNQVVAKLPAPAEASDSEPPAPPKKRTLNPARYISRHKGKPPQRNR